MSKAAHSIDRILALALQPWALEPTMLATVVSVLVRRATQGPHALDADALATIRAHGRVELAALGGPDLRPGASGRATSSVAVIPLHGVIAPRMTALTDISGGTTFESATRAVKDAAADPAVSTVVLDIDSPGGSVLGSRVFARAVLQARTQKPVVAQIQYQGCSAAYWAAACATEIVAAPGALLGSIGVYMVHDDISRLLDAEGVTRTMISAGDHKLDGHESAPLSDRAKARYGALVEESYTHFVTDVAAGRGRTAEEVRTGFGLGGVVTCDEALALGMVDREGTLDDTLARFGVSASRSLADTPQEPARATGQDWRREQAASESVLRAILLRSLQC